MCVCAYVCVCSFKDERKTSVRLCGALTVYGREPTDRRGHERAASRAHRAQHHAWSVGWLGCSQTHTHTDLDRVVGPEIVLVDRLEPACACVSRTYAGGERVSMNDGDRQTQFPSQGTVYAPTSSCVWQMRCTLSLVSELERVRVGGWVGMAQASSVSQPAYVCERGAWLAALRLTGPRAEQAAQDHTRTHRHARTSSRR